MVGSASKIGEEDFLTARLILWFVAGFGGDEYGIDLLQHVGIVERHCPAILAYVVLVKDSQAVGDVLLANMSTPDMKDHIALELAWCVQIICIKDKRLSFDVENSSDRVPSFPVILRVVNIHNVEIPSSQYVLELARRRFQFLFPLQLRFRRFKFC